MGSIFGLLLLIAVPNHLQKRAQSQACELAEAFRTHSMAFQNYQSEFGCWPPDQATGEIPLGMEGRLTGFGQRSPAGGQWDWQGEEHHGSAAICLVQCEASHQVLERVDQMLDDGDLAQGNIFQDGNRIVLLLK